MRKLSSFKNYILVCSFLLVGVSFLYSTEAVASCPPSGNGFTVTTNKSDPNICQVKFNSARGEQMEQYDHGVARGLVSGNLVIGNDGYVHQAGNEPAVTSIAPTIPSTQPQVTAIQPVTVESLSQLPGMPEGCTLDSTGNGCFIYDLETGKTTSYSNTAYGWQETESINSKKGSTVSTQKLSNPLDYYEDGVSIDTFSTADPGKVRSEMDSLFGSDSKLGNCNSKAECQVLDSDNKQIGRINADGSGITHVNPDGEPIDAVVADAQNACSSTTSYAKTSCNLDNNQAMLLVQTMLPQMAGMGKDAKGACEAVSNTGMIASMLSLGMGGNCWAATTACESACTVEGLENVSAAQKAEIQAANANNLKVCNQQTVNYTKMFISGFQAYMAKEQGKTCEDIATDDLTAGVCPPDRISDPTVEACRQTACTMYPQNVGHPDCAGYENQANSTNPAICDPPSGLYNPACLNQCQVNPNFSVNCQEVLRNNGYDIGDDFNNALNGDEYDNNGLGNALADDDLFANDFEGFDGPIAEKGELAAGGNVGSASSLGSSGGGGGSYGGGGGAGEGSGAEGINTDILGRLTGGSGGGGGGGGFAGAYAGGAGNAWKQGGRKAGNYSKTDKFDLNKMLSSLGLKGKNNKRGTASLSSKQSLNQAGITKANGLTNFQKVTRMINKKRPSLDN